MRVRVVAPMRHHHLLCALAVVTNASELIAAIDAADLQPYGMPGCQLFAVPALPSLLGAPAFHRAFSLEPGANALGAVDSRGGESRIGG
jgi:hypothetical protein